MNLLLLILLKSNSRMPVVKMYFFPESEGLGFWLHALDKASYYKYDYCKPISNRFQAAGLSADKEPPGQTGGLHRNGTIRPEHKLNSTSGFHDLGIFGLLGWGYRSGSVKGGIWSNR